MKKNIALFLILISLLSVIYYVEEVSFTNKKMAQALVSNELGVPTEIVFSSFAILMDGDNYHFKNSDEVVDKKKLDRLLGMLSYLQVIRELNPDALSQQRDSKNDFFAKDALTLSFIFKQAKISFVLGNKIKFSQNFYMKMIDADQNERWLIVNDTSPMTGMYRQEKVHRNAEKFDRITHVFSLKEKSLYQNRITEFNNKKILKVTIKNPGNREYNVDYVQQLTRPEIYNGMMYDFPAFSQLLSDLNNIIILKEYKKIDVSLLNAKILSLNVTYATKKNVTESTDFLVYEKYNGVTGHYLYTSSSQQLFIVDKTSIEWMFDSVQHYWNLHLFDKQKIINYTNSSLRPLMEILQKNAKYVSNIDSIENRINDFKKIKIANDVISFLLDKEKKELFVAHVKYGFFLFYDAIDDKQFEILSNMELKKELIPNVL